MWVLHRLFCRSFGFEAGGWPGRRPWNCCGLLLLLPLRLVLLVAVRLIFAVLQLLRQRERRKAAVLAPEALDVRSVFARRRRAIAGQEPALFEPALLVLPEPLAVTLKRR